MAQYTITLKVEGSRKDSIEKKLRVAFGEDAPIFSVEKVTSPESRAARLAEAEGMADDARQIVEELKDEMEQWYDSIPENLQNGDKANEVQESKDNLEEVLNNLENIGFDSVSFPGMF